MVKQRNIERPAFQTRQLSKTAYLQPPSASCSHRSRMATFSCSTVAVMADVTCWKCSSCLSSRVRFLSSSSCSRSILGRSCSRLVAWLVSCYGQHKSQCLRCLLELSLAFAHLLLDLLSAFLAGAANFLLSLGLLFRDLTDDASAAAYTTLLRGACLRILHLRYLCQSVAFDLEQLLRRLLAVFIALAWGSSFHGLILGGRHCVDC